MYLNWTANNYLSKQQPWTADLYLEVNLWSKGTFEAIFAETGIPDICPLLRWFSGMARRIRVCLCDCRNKVLTCSHTHTPTRARPSCTQDYANVPRFSVMRSRFLPAVFIEQLSGAPAGWGCDAGGPSPLRASIRTVRQCHLLVCHTRQVALSLQTWMLIWLIWIPSEYPWGPWECTSRCDVHMRMHAFVYYISLTATQCHDISCDVMRCDAILLYAVICYGMVCTTIIMRRVLGTTFVTLCSQHTSLHPHLCTWILTYNTHTQTHRHIDT